MLCFKLMGFLAALVAASPLDHPKVPLHGRSTSIMPDDVPNFIYWVQYSAAAYCQTNWDAPSLVACYLDRCPSVEANGAELIKTVLGPVSGLSSFVAVDHPKNTIVVAVRGTSNIRNWVTNLSFAAADCGHGYPANCTMHTGFQSAWNEIQPELLSAVLRARKAHPDHRVVVTGHSLGGAVATIATAHLRTFNGISADLYTYGSPRVGNGVFSDYVSAHSGLGSTYRITHGADPVPRVPPLLLGYRHTTPEYWVSGTPDADGVGGAESVVVCEGVLNIMCNGGTFEWDPAAHSFYFQDVGNCETEFGTSPGSSSSSLLGETNGSLPDELVAERVGTLAKLDKAYVEALEG